MQNSFEKITLCELEMMKEPRNYVAHWIESNWVESLLLFLSFFFVEDEIKCHIHQKNKQKFMPNVGSVEAYSFQWAALETFVGDEDKNT